MTKPSFFILGAQKAGTSTLHDILAQVPELCLPFTKETKFFVNDEFYARGLAFYDRFFGECRSDARKLRGEIDPDYMYFPTAISRLRSTFGPEVKLICILRDPVMRAYSHYLMSVNRGYEVNSFEAALNLEAERLEQSEFNRHHFSYLDRGFYGRQLASILQSYDRKNLLVIPFEHFVGDKRAHVQQILAFLDVRCSIDLNYDVASNPARSPRFLFLNKLLFSRTVLNTLARVLVPDEMRRIKLKRSLHRFAEQLNEIPLRHRAVPPKVRIRMLEALEKDIALLSALTGIDFSYWMRSS